ncbi:hypothetical protein, partial [Candidatus Similichlamydia laticola]|uniref:hypothetical protein n=1 Tax=Candidatus Similichlamydia laticola TaxID=2170265 RepID=UPI000DF84F0D
KESISIEEVYAIAQLAALDLTPEEAEQFRVQIENVATRSIPLLSLLNNKNEFQKEIEEHVSTELRKGEPVVSSCLVEGAPLTIAGLICSPPVLYNE